MDSEIGSPSFSDFYSKGDSSSMAINLISRIKLIILFRDINS